MTSGQITAIHLHPIKSCRRIEVDRAIVGPTGLEGDRQWQVSSGLKPMTQRTKAVMATVVPEPIDGGLRLSAPDQPTIEVAAPTETSAETGSLIGVKVAVGDAGDEAAGWFSQLLGDDVRLYRRTAESNLTIPPDLDVFGQSIAFGDLAPVLVTNEASLRWLADAATEPVPMTRFRPNLVIHAGEPWIEDTFTRFTLGAAELRYGMVWPRCAVPQVDQETGERNREPALALKAHRFVTEAPSISNDVVRSIVEGQGVFGIGCAIGPVGTEVAIGDPLTVLETHEPLLAPPPA